MNMLTKLAIGGVIAFIAHPKGRKMISDTWCRLKGTVSGDLKDAKESVEKAANKVTSSKAWHA